MYKFHINGKNSEWNFVNIVRDLLREDPDWEEIKDAAEAKKVQLHYCDLDQYNPVIQNYITADQQFVNKDFLANKLGTSKHIPMTLVIKNGRMMRTKHRLTTINRNGKWFLKPTGGYGGRGIKVFMGVNNYRRLLKRGTNYVLQPEVSNPMLYNGRKFDVRSFVAMVYVRGKYHLYLYPDSICRVSLTAYNKKSANKNSDLTNCSIQENHKEYSTEKINKLMSRFPWYEEVLPKLKHVVGCCLKKMASALKRPSNRKIVEVIALDTIITQNKEVILLEVNRNVGYGYDRKPSYVVEIYKSMYRDLIHFAFLPLIKGKRLEDPHDWIKCTTI